MELRTESVAPMKGKIPTALTKLRVGDVFWHKVAIDSEDVADPKSDTAKE